MPDEIPPKHPLEPFPTRRKNTNEDGTTAAAGFGEADGAGRGEGGDGIPPALAREMPAGRLEPLTEAAKNYARNARSENTHRAYESDWRQFSSWLRRQGFDPLPPDPQTVGLYLAACAGGVSAGARNIGAGKGKMAPMSVTSLERRLSGICWRYRQLGEPLDASDRHIATVLAGIRRAHGRPPVQKQAIFAEDLLTMLSVLDNDLRGLRDKAILAIGFAGGLRRSEIVGLDCGPDQSDDGTGWIEVFGGAKSASAEKTAEKDDAGARSSSANEGGLLLTINGKTGWREVEIGRGSSPLTCPVAMLETWMRLARVAHGPVFRRVTRKNGGVTDDRLTDKHVARLVQKTALAAGIRGDLSEGERKLAFAGHSLRAGLASSAQIEEAHVQRHLGHASAEMTRRYQRKRDRFKVNLTKAAGL